MKNRRTFRYNPDTKRCEEILPEQGRLDVYYIDTSALDAMRQEEEKEELKLEAALDEERRKGCSRASSTPWLAAYPTNRGAL